MTSGRRVHRARTFPAGLGATALAVGVTLTVTAVATAAIVAAASGRAPGPSPAARRAAEPPLTPVVVELFTSQGCSSCPPADALLRSFERNQPVAGTLIVPLSEHVDYWNRLGWRDPFSAPRFSDRQRTYGEALDLPTLYTPMLVVDGRFVVIGSEAGEARRAIVQAARSPKTPVAVRVAGAAASRVIEVTATVGPADSARGEDDAGVWLAITETGLATNVMAGENRFRRLRHTGVVRHLERLATGAIPGAADPAWRVGRRLRLEPDWKRSNLRAVVFLQDSSTSAILGAATTPVG